MTDGKGSKGFTSWLGEVQPLDLVNQLVRVELEVEVGALALGEVLGTPLLLGAGHALDQTARYLCISFRVSVWHLKTRGLRCDDALTWRKELGSFSFITSMQYSSNPVVCFSLTVLCCS